ncbi:MAG: hypothetical protein RLZZ630_83 [Bacteroidota bacterium]|jgi:hypothetical protein
MLSILWNSVMRLLSLMLLFSVTSLHAQNYKPYIAIEGVQDFAVDPMGNCYTIRGGEIVKYNAAGKEMVRYSRKDLGSPTAIDAGNPLRIQVFYAEFALIRILDNNLIDQSEINLREMGILQPRVAAATPDQGIWIFDEIPCTLTKVDTRLKTTGLSIDLNLLLSRRPQPVALLANRNWMVMQEEDRFILFDQFGTVTGTLPVRKRSRLVELREEELVYEEEGNATTYSLRLRTSKSFALECASDFTKMHVIEDRCFFLKNGVLFIPR